MAIKSPSGKDLEEVLKTPRLSAKEAAEYLGINQRTLANLRCKKDVVIPYTRFGRRKVLYFRGDLDQYLAANYHDVDRVHHFDEDSNEGES